MKKYTHIFFDLDRTLWDFEANSEEAINELFYEYGLEREIRDFEHFMSVYRKCNAEQWTFYRAGTITKDELRLKRFLETLRRFGNDDPALANEMDEKYVRRSPYKNRLFPHAEETLEYLSAKYRLYIITNGFKEVQYSKLDNCGLSRYFRKVYISEEVGSIKPEKKIFEVSIADAGACKSTSLMVGDDLAVDVTGARNAGIDQVFFNPSCIKHNEVCTFEINSLLELTEIL
ncbi:MAG: YjjG family noncanonical pyrimidine nucleotidase [Bacteroidetes bacterium]|nr:YjjG family noncanonical pyrimidine nucleotidase [Bacteroidota bacterium]